MTPSPYGPHVEQVGWGVARQVVRTLREGGATAAGLDVVPGLAEDDRHLVYAVLERRSATGLAWVTLGRDTARYEGEVLGPDAVPGTREALVVRALYDVARHGLDWLEVPDQPGWDSSPFG